MAVVAIAHASSYGMILKCLLETIRDNNIMPLSEIGIVFAHAVEAIDAGVAPDDTGQMTQRLMRENVFRSALELGIEIPLSGQLPQGTIQ
jgi:hypothetical protein